MVKFFADIGWYCLLMTLFLIRQLRIKPLSWFIFCLVSIVGFTSTWLQSSGDVLYVACNTTLLCYWASDQIQPRNPINEIKLIIIYCDDLPFQYKLSYYCFSHTPIPRRFLFPSLRKPWTTEFSCS